MQRSVNSPRIDTRRYALGEEHGGTGAVNLVDAAKNLNIVTSDMLDQPDGVAGLDEDLFLSTAIFPTGNGTRRCSLSGSSTLVQNVAGTYTITDFDSTKTYTISVSSGIVSRTDDTITLTPPSSSGNITLTVNGQEYAIAVVSPRPATPSIVTPVNGNTVKSKSVYVTSSDYTYLGTPIAHLSSHWQVSTDPLFSTLVNESANDTVNLLDWVFTAVSSNTSYYLRVRYSDTSGNWSEWSYTSVFYTAEDLYDSVEATKLVASDMTLSGQFGYKIALTSDGSRAVIGSAFADNGSVSGSGALYVFRRSGLSWTLEQRILPPSPGTNDAFGKRVSITSDGTRICASSLAETVSGVTQAGVVRIYYRESSGTTWTLEATLSASDKVAGDLFGYGAAISGDGTRVFSGSRGANNGSTLDVGAVYVFTRSGTTWTQSQKLLATPYAAGDFFGSSLDCNADGTVFTASSPTGDGAVTDSGTIYVFRHNGTQFVQEQVLAAPSAVAGDLFGTPVHICKNGDRIIVGTAAQTASGKVYIYHYSNSTWSLEQTLTVNGDIGDGTNYFLSPSISADGSRIVIGVRGATLNGVTAGAAYVYDRSGTTWSKTANLISSDYAAGDYFGFDTAVSDDGQYILASSTGQDPSAIADAGAVYVFS